MNPRRRIEAASGESRRSPATVRARVAKRPRPGGELVREVARELFYLEQRRHLATLPARTGMWRTWPSDAEGAERELYLLEARAVIDAVESLR